MELACQSASITRFAESLGNQNLILRDSLPVLSATGRPGIPAGQERCPTGRAHRALAKRILKTNAFPDEPVEHGSLSMGIAQGPNGVIALLIGADPKNVRWFRHPLL